MVSIQVVLAVELLLAEQAVVRREFRASSIHLPLGVTKEAGLQSIIISNRLVMNVPLKGLVLHQRLEHLECHLFYACCFQPASVGFGPQSQSTGNSFAYIMNTFPAHLKRHLACLDLSASSAELSSG